MSYNEFIESLDPLQAELISYLDQQFIILPEVSRKIRYRIPFYDANSWFCYLNPIKKDKVELCFLKGIEMCETFPILDRKDRKMVSGLMMEVNEDIPMPIILDMVKHAIRLNNGV